MKGGSRKRELAHFMALAIAAGWRVEQRRCNHIAFFPAKQGQPPIFTGSTPSDWRSHKNLRSQLRRAGLDV